MHTALQISYVNNPPQILEQERNTLRTKHDSCAMEKPYMGCFGYAIRFHKNNLSSGILANPGSGEFGMHYLEDCRSNSLK